MVADVGNDFTIKIYHNSKNPEECFLHLVDYDGAVGAIGVVNSVQEAIDNSELFFRTAFPYYEAKHAKYSVMPELKLNESGAFDVSLKNLKEEGWPFEDYEVLDDSSSPANSM